MADKFTKGRKITAPQKTEALYRNEMLKLLSLTTIAIRKHIMPRFDYVNDRDKPNAQEIEQAFKQVRQDVEQQRDRADEAIILLFLMGLFAYQKRKFYNMIQRSKLPDIIKLKAGLINTQSVFELAKVENSKILKSVPETQISQMEAVVLAEMSKLSTGSKAKLEAELAKIAKKNQGRAGRIALDQNEKVNGKLNEESQKQTGAIGYQWINRGDKRVRGRKDGRYPNSAFNHWNRGGRFFLWSYSDEPPIAPDGDEFKQPPADGSPGVAVMCRCIAVPIWVDGS